MITLTQNSVSIKKGYGAQYGAAICYAEIKGTTYEVEIVREIGSGKIHSVSVLSYPFGSNENTLTNEGVEDEIREAFEK